MPLAKRPIINANNPWVRQLGIGLFPNEGYLNERRQNEQLRAQLIRELGSSDNGITGRAIAELRAHGWGFENDKSLVGTILDWANLEWARLTKVNLARARLVSANLRGAFLRGANLKEALLIYANLEEASMRGSNLMGANLKAASLKKAKLTNVNLQGASLREADLEQATLKGTNLEDATLAGANLKGASHVTPAQLCKAGSLKSTTMVDGSSPEKWALRLFGERKIDEDTFNTLVRLAGVGADEEE